MSRLETPQHPAAGSRERRSRRGRFAGRIGPRLLVMAAVTLSSVLILAGCGSSATSATSPSTTPSPAITPSPATAASPASVASSSSKGGSSGSTTYPAGKEDICRARDQLRTSIDQLTNTQLVAEGTNGLKAAVDQVQSDFDAVKAAAMDDYHAPVTALQSALQQLQTAVADVGNGDARQNLTAISTAITTTGAAAGNLFTQLKTDCGS